MAKLTGEVEGSTDARGIRHGFEGIKEAKMSKVAKMLDCSVNSGDERSELCFCFKSLEH